MVDLNKSIDTNTIAYDRNIIRSTNTITTKANMDQEYKTFINNMVKQTIIDPRREWIPSVNGWYYVNFVGGTWENQLISIANDKSFEYKEFSTGLASMIPRAKKHFGHLIKDINPPQLGLDFDGISGRLRTISIATRVNLSNEFSITWKDDAEATVFKYHEAWQDYVEAHKKGFIKSTSAYSDSSFFIDVPYFNAIWIAIFKPFTFELIGLVKLMGVSPATQLPLQELLGQRGQSQATTYNINYKVIDAIVQMFDGKPSGNFYQEFMNEQYNFFETNISTSLNLSSSVNLNNIKLFN